MARLAKYALKGFPDADWEKPEDMKKVFDAQDAAMKKLQETSDALRGDEVVGGVLKFGRGDGYAIYVVTKEDPLTLTHVPYCDAYAVEAALIRGLTRKDVLRMLKADRSMAKLFSKAKSGV